MKHVLLLLAAFIMMAVSGLEARTMKVSDEPVTIRTRMQEIHDYYGVNFVYDSTLDLNFPSDGRKLTLRQDQLEACLAELFHGTGINYDINRKYIVLTHADSKKKPKDYTIFIEEQHDTLRESVVTAMVDPKRNTTQTGLKRIDSKDLNSGFALFSTPDVIKTLQMLPGVSSGTELLSGFYVHGGDGSDNLFLLDGVPIYSVSHLLGLFSSFNTDVIGSMDFYKSGFPARYGSKMSSVVDITTRDGDFNDYHGTFALGLIDGRLQFEGPLWKDRTSFNVGLRRTWTETLTLPVFAIVNARNRPDKVNGGYAFTDLNAKVTHKFSKDNILSGNFYIGRDAFRMLMDSQYTDYEGVLQRDIEKGSLAWGNILGSVNWSYKINDDISMKNIAYYSGSNSNMTMSIREIEGDEFDATNGEYNTSDVHNMGLKSDWFHSVGSSHKLRYGATLQYHIYCPESTAKAEVQDKNQHFTYVAYSDALRYDTIEASIYGEDEIAVNDDFSVNAGLRYSLYSTGGKTWHSVEPRIAMKYSITDRIAAKASYTEMSQPAHLISSIYLDLPTNAWLPSTARVRPSRSREVAAGVYTDLVHNLHLNVEGWYKHMYNLLEYAGAYNIFPPLTGWETSYRVGQGRSWGAELDFGYDNGRTEANVYYTLSWSQRKFDDFYHSWYKDRNDSRHKLTVMAKHKFGKRFELYGAFNWHSGYRVTIATHQTPDGRTDLYTEPNNVKLPDYHRLDLGFNFIKTTKRGNTSIWNLSLYNAYCYTNPITAYAETRNFDVVAGESNIRERFAFYGTSVGIIPIVPTFSYTLKF